MREHADEIAFLWDTFGRAASKGTDGRQLATLEDAAPPAPPAIIASVVVLSLRGHVEE